MVRRDRDPQDGRRVLLRVTPAGVRLREAKSVLDPARVEQVLAHNSPPPTATRRWPGWSCSRARRSGRCTVAQPLLRQSGQPAIRPSPPSAGGCDEVDRASSSAGWSSWSRRSAAIGAMLPRSHKARAHAAAEPDAGRGVAGAAARRRRPSDVPVDVLESEPPRRLRHARHRKGETNFGGTWTIAIKSDAASGAAVTITEDGWVANPIFRFVSRVVIGHHATMDAMLKKIAATLNEEAALSGSD